MVQFNFGPIARTEAGNTRNTINLASLPLHVILNALVGSTSVEEFIAWLWHDLYKPAFHWVPSGKGVSWHHIPGIGAFAKGEPTFASLTKVPIGLVSSHHPKATHYHSLWDRKTEKLVDPSTKLPCPSFNFLEPNFISDQGDQVNLGDAVNYIQLSLAAEPALPTLLARSVIANAFIEVVTKDVAEALQQAFIADGRTPIERVRFEFETTSNITFSPQCTNTEIWNKVGKHFDIRMDDNTFIMRHLIPVAESKHEPFATVFTADLTGTPLSPGEMLDNVLSLAELLVLYQDNRTVIIAVPQSQLYTINLSQIRKATLDTSRDQLEQDFNVLTKKNSVDYLKAAFDSQIEIREVPGRLSKSGHSRPLNDAVQRPMELLTEARNSSEGRLCCLTGTWFKTDLPAGPLSSNDLFKPAFVDTEFVGLIEDATQQRYLAPLTYLYVINSSGAGRGEETRKALRGAFAYLAPASHFAIDEQGTKAVEQPPLDRGNRFANQLNRVTVTTQEFTLFQQMSRRIIAQLWESIAQSEPLPLPYLGAIALTQEPEQRAHIVQLLPQLNLLFSEVSLRTYPFELGIRPAIEIGLETSVHDKKLHHTRHTLLKTIPHIITVDPQSTIPILVDDNVQVNLTQAFFKRVDLFTEFTNEFKNRKKRINQKDLWLKLVLANNDPVTAVFESAVATINMRKLPKTLSLETAAFNAAEKFWEEHIDIGDFAESWEQYEQLNQKAINTLEEFPALLLLLQILQKKNEN